MDDLIEQLAATPRTLALLVVEASDARLDAAADGAWSARTILAHLRDDEYLCMRAALERMLAEEVPLVHFIDGADWEPRRNCSRDRKDLLLADFALQRQASLGILRGLRPQDWQRTGVRDGGTFTIADLAAAWVRHDAAHIVQLETALGETLAGVIERRARPAE
ncbi:MAG: DinB family protein [Chloroflexi bacterium]|nr:DinB family protein [Chloroflexota bacterium]